MRKRFGKTYKLLATSLAAIMLTGMIAGCTSDKAKESNEPKVLRIGVMYGGGGNDQYFRQQFTDVYEYTHQNVTIEIVPAINSDQFRYAENQSYQPPDTVKSLKKLMTGSNPVDIIVSDTNSLKKLIDENLLKQLDPMIQEDKFDTADIVPSVIDGIKQMGNNNIYALAPTFIPSALFYNKKIFQDAGVEVPKDGMTYDDIFNLARRVTKGEGNDRIFGLAFNQYNGASASDDVYKFVQPLQLRYYDEKAEKMTVNTPQWEKAISTIAKLRKDKVIFENVQMNSPQENQAYNPIDNDVFMSGKTAMVMGNIGLVTELSGMKEAAKTNKKVKAFDWDVVTMPTHPEKPGVGGDIYLNNYMSINASAPNPETAWDFIKFLNGPEWAKIKARSTTYEMVSRKSYIKPVNGLNYNVSAFYKLKPVPPANANDEKLQIEKPGIFGVAMVGQTFIQEVIDNKKTPKEALQAWERKGNEMLQELKKNPKTQFQPDGTPYIPPADGSGFKG
ncbi:extracellular solute-binding protein [Paenibacillus sp. YPG26]|uniref:ABC transporter substrate-binding protein n=1 Tax=Paenibacillus sp. YPG26 TaxID=2878915 RepID=UPI00203E5869|nr:extracellular solute-binding protein [Paenibacillus sp. YPG26]USB34533.1 extracellular solute-binding protein [Paenibacillus sp. YPG26]